MKSNPATAFLALVLCVCLPILAGYVLTGCQHVPAALQLSACQLSEQYTTSIERDIDYCHTDNCVAWYVQREAQQRTLCQLGDLPAGVQQ